MLSRLAHRPMLLAAADKGGGASSSEKEYLTKDDLSALLDERDEKLTAKMGQVSNQAFTAQAKRLGLTDIASKLDALGAQLAAKAEEEAQGRTAAEEKQKAAPAGPDPETAKLLKKLQADLEAQKTAREAAEKKTAEIEAKRALKEEDDAVMAALAKAGVVEHLRRPRMAELRADGAIKRDEHGNVCLASVKDGIEALAPAEEAIGAWAKTPAGKHFLPAVQGGGSGGTGGTGSTSQKNGQGNYTAGVMDLLKEAGIPLGTDPQ